MNQAELAQKLTELSAALDADATQLQKGIDEITALLQGGGNVTPEVEAALATLQGGADSVKSKSQAVDDIVPDQP